MKQLKVYHCIECTCHRTGLTGDFIIDQDYFKHTGEKASLDSLVFKNLTDLFRYANEKILTLVELIIKFYQLTLKVNLK